MSITFTEADEIGNLIKKGYKEQLEKRFNKKPATVNCTIPIIGRDRQILHSPLTYASFYGMRTIVELIMKFMTHHDVDNNSNITETALIAAIDGEHFDLVRYFVEYIHVDINKTDVNKDSPLSHACILKDFRLVQYLVNNGANINQPNRDGITPLFYSADMPPWIGWPRNGTDVSHYMCKKSINIVRFLLRQEYINLDHRDNYGHTLLGYFIDCNPSREQQHSIIQLIENESKHKKQKNIKNLLLVYKKAFPVLDEDVTRILATYL